MARSLSTSKVRIASSIPSTRSRSNSCRSPLLGFIHPQAQLSNAVPLHKQVFQQVTVQALRQIPVNHSLSHPFASSRILLGRQALAVQCFSRRLWPASYWSPLPLRCHAARGAWRPRERGQTCCFLVQRRLKEYAYTELILGGFCY